MSNNTHERDILGDIHSGGDDCAVPADLRVRVLLRFSVEFPVRTRLGALEESGPTRQRNRRKVT